MIVILSSNVENEWMLREGCLVKCKACKGCCFSFFLFEKTFYLCMNLMHSAVSSDTKLIVCSSFLSAFTNVYIYSVEI